MARSREPGLQRRPWLSPALVAVGAVIVGAVGTAVEVAVYGRSSEVAITVGAVAAVVFALGAAAVGLLVLRRPGTPPGLGAVLAVAMASSAAMNVADSHLGEGRSLLPGIATAVVVYPVVLLCLLYVLRRWVLPKDERSR